QIKFQQTAAPVSWILACKRGLSVHVQKFLKQFRRQTLRKPADETEIIAGARRRHLPSPDTRRTLHSMNVKRYNRGIRKQPELPIFLNHNSHVTHIDQLRLEAAIRGDVGDCAFATLRGWKCFHRGSVMTRVQYPCCNEYHHEFPLHDGHRTGTRASRNSFSKVARFPLHRRRDVSRDSSDGTKGAEAVAVSIHFPRIHSV